MAKIQSRTEKFKEYREEIKNSCKEEIEIPSQAKIPSNFFEPEIIRLLLSCILSLTVFL